MIPRWLMCVALVLSTVTNARAQSRDEKRAIKAMLQGDKEAARGNLTAAINLYEQARRLTPERSGPYAALAAVWLRHGNCEQALANARRYRELKPGAANPQVDEAFGRCEPKPVPSAPTEPRRTTPAAGAATPVPRPQPTGGAPPADEPPTVRRRTSRGSLWRGRLRFAGGFASDLAAPADSNAVSMGLGIRFARRIELRATMTLAPVVLVPELQVGLLQAGRVSWFGGVGTPLLLSDVPGSPSTAIMADTGVRVALTRSLGFETTVAVSRADGRTAYPLWVQGVWTL